MCRACVNVTRVCPVFQMHHPIQMKPADSEKSNGECLYASLFFLRSSDCTFVLGVCLCVCVRDWKMDELLKPRRAAGQE